MAMSTGGGAGGVKAEPNVTPMIDVMLVLLIIFMLVVPAISAGFQAIPPQGQNLKPHPEEERDQVLGIDRNGQYFLNKAPIPNPELGQRLKSIYDNRTEDKILYFKADNKLKYSKIQEAVETARHSGVRVMAAITEPKNSGLFQADKNKEKK